MMKWIIKLYEKRLSLKSKYCAIQFTMEELFRDYEGEPTKETPIIFRAEGNEKW